MNREYYEALGLKEDADQNDIKRAYFKLVRKYSPEKEPEKFREIREAYEYLSRAGQDQEGPDFGEFENVFEARMADQIKRADRDNDTGLALKTCEEAIRYYPEALYFQYERIRLERRMGHTGRAVKHAEALVEKNRENKWFLRELAVSYIERGYTKKAYGACAAAYELGCRDLDFLSLFAREAYEGGYFNRGMELLFDLFKRKETWEKDELPEMFDMLGSLLEMVLVADIERGGEVWSLIHDCAEKYGDDPVSHLQEFSAMITMTEMSLDSEKRYLSECVSLMDLSKKLSAGGEEDSLIQKIGNVLKLNVLEETVGLSEELKNYLMFRLDAAGLDADEFRISDAECKLFLFKEREETLKGLDKLKEAAPDIYEGLEELHRTLLEDGAFYREQERLLNYYRRQAFYYQASSMRYFLKYPEERFEGKGRVIVEGDTDTPYIRTEKKIGRNDPCPCGSGKKYKLCCMRKPQSPHGSPNH